MIFKSSGIILYNIDLLILKRALVTRYRDPDANTIGQIRVSQWKKQTSVFGFYEGDASMATRR
jgi:hypothetical protein